MKYFFHPEAEAEFFDAIDYYEQIEQGLGYDFANEVHFAIENIIGFPNAWTSFGDDIRRCMIRRFPYGIIYSCKEELVFILAVMHLHRDPIYWKERV